MIGWMIIAGFAWMWLWGFIITAASVHTQKGRMRLGGWDWTVCAFWPIATPLALSLLIWESYMRGRG